MIDKYKSILEVENVLSAKSNFIIKSESELNKCIDYIIQLITDAYTLYNSDAFPSSVFLSIAVIEEYGEKPAYLQWNLFKDRNWLTIKFDDKEFEEAKQWAEDTVKAIEEETAWFPNPSQYFCYNICDMRNCACEYKP